MAGDWPRPIVHIAIEAKDPERQRAFYAAMFNWTIGDGPIMNFAAGIGGPEPGPAGHIRRGERSGFNVFVQVLDLHESLERCRELGGTVVTEAFQFPNTPTLAAILDPEGNPITLVQQ